MPKKSKGEEWVDDEVAPAAGELSVIFIQKLANRLMLAFQLTLI